MKNLEQVVEHPHTLMNGTTNGGSPICRSCGAALCRTFVNLGMSPLANSYRRKSELSAMEPFYPLHVYVCDGCFLVQLEECSSPIHIFSDYAYFSSYSDSWLLHAKAYVEQISQRLGLNQRSQVIELASNDGYLLQYFVQRSVPVLGIEPAGNVAKVAQEKGIPTVVEFFGEKLALNLRMNGQLADLVIGNNVLAHVPQLNDFVRGIKIVLKPTGIVTMEFPHLMRLIEENQFDTIYHEHFSYFSLITVERVFRKHGLRIFDVEEIPTHGGSLRIFACHEDDPRAVRQSVDDLRQKEAEMGFTELSFYSLFAERVMRTKRKLLEFLIQAKAAGKTIVGYGAPAKGNTLLNYCGIGTDFLDFTVDRSPHKQGKFLPGTHIPILAPDMIATTKPDYVLILPWNLKDEVMQQMTPIRRWGGKFVVPIPEVQVLS